MDIKELQDYRLSDAVKFHDNLNPKIWGSDEHLLPEVREKLMAIAEDFKEFLGLDLEVKDITISGSNASYTYSDHSDIDLHLVADLPKADASEIYRELFDAKKYQYNDQHNFKISGYDVELYVQNANEPPKSNGIYSVLHNDWIKVPARRKPTVNDESVKSKYEDIGYRIDGAIESGDSARLEDIAKKVRVMRQAGLEQTGEFGPENLAFKVLRSNGTLEKLRAARMAAKDRELSIAEAGKKKQRFKYGFSSNQYWEPGFDYYSKGTTDTDADFESAPVKEGADNIDAQLQNFVKFCAEQLKLSAIPKIKIKRDPAWSERNNSFGRYVPDTDTLILSIANRHPLDIMRTMAHELTHRKQDERSDMPIGAGDTGSKWENDANAQAGILMRKFAELHPEYFAKEPISEDEDDVNGEEEKQPGKLLPYPAGTVKVDVSDTLDWYEIGQNVSDLDDADPEKFNQGPPHTVMVFPNEPEEERFVKDINKLGLKTHDVNYPRQAVKEASGYIPVNDREARDPRYSMALTVDIKPGENQRQAAKMGWKTNPAGTPPTAKTNGLLESLQLKLDQVKAAPLNEEQLDEVNMSPGALADWAKSAGNMQSGFEAELIFTGLGDEGEYDPEYEPDYSYDPRPDSIEEIIDFFQSGDFADLSNLAADQIRRQMEEDYMNWLDEKMYDDWDNDKDAAVREYLENEEGLEGEELDTRTDAAMADQNRDYDNALEFFTDDWRSNNDNDETDWLRSSGIRSMSDAQNAYDELYWPHMEDMNSGSGGDGEFSEASAERLAADLSETLGVKTTVSTGYHGAKRDTSTWIFEPDGSLEGDESGDMPVEIVSPPMPLNQTLEILPKFFAWAAANGGYANKSTGFHMSVSMPGHEGQQLDFTKLALFLGDKYVLEQFGRAGNSYAASAIDKIKSKKGGIDPEAVMNAMRKHLNQFASRALAQPSGFGKYVTINPKTNYVEFRSAGGKDYFEDMDKVKNTMMRYARALNIAMDPDAEKQEYGKKLYKLLTDAETYQVTDPKTGKKRTEAKTNFEKDAISVFSRYAAGTLPKTALSSFIKAIQKERETKRQAAEGKPMIWQVTAGPQSMKIVATGKQAAKLRGAEDWNIDPNSERFDSIRAVPVGPAPSSIDGLTLPHFPQGRDQISNTNHWVVFKNLRNVAYLRGRTEEDLIRSINTWANKKGISPADFSVRPADVQDIENARAEGRLDTPASQTPASDQMTAPAADDPSGNYVLRHREGNEGTGPIVYRFHAANNTEAIEKSRQWTTARGLDRRSVWLDHISGVPPEVLNARPEPTAPAAPARGNILPGSSLALALQRAYPDVLNIQDTSTTGKWVIYSKTSYDSLEIVPATTGLDALEQFHRWMSAGDHRDSYGMRPADTMDIVNAQHAARQAQQATDTPVSGLPSQTDAENRLAIGDQTADANYEIIDNSNQTPVFKLIANTYTDALRRYNQWLEIVGVPAGSTDYGVRRLPPRSPVETEPQNFPAARQTGEFTGRWRVVSSSTGETVYEFGGAGNRQADANRIAAEWARRTGFDDQVEVYPVMR